ncbi:DUF952 domain-containing protein [Emcibacter nanhaiensis]|uniref:DUF952 domain-containing protein n=1 Tax=Emcibacter nanhaiensis TaxID=1505037 RepID=A0A501PJ21_9PROT|nr:DUF952 domain-containing protein [Emcibacter nanhaiensis]TPD59756.1 DUF952 domain-containing protein [Emcibacter nanhaiensis]
MTREEWAVFRSQGSFAGSSLDQSSGYIHLSSAAQVPGTLEKYFHGRKDLVLLSLDQQKLVPGFLKWEISRDNEKFPHYYADLPLGGVVRVDDLELEQNGRHIIPL